MLCGLYVSRLVWKYPTRCGQQFQRFGNIDIIPEHKNYGRHTYTYSDSSILKKNINVFGRGKTRILWRLAVDVVAKFQMWWKSSLRVIE